MLLRLVSAAARPALLSRLPLAAPQVLSRACSTAAGAGPGGATAGSGTFQSAEVMAQRATATMAVTGAAPGSYFSDGKAKLMDTLYFRKLGATKPAAEQGGAFTPDCFSGQTLLIVNTASQCGYTPQLRDMQALHKQYSKVGLTILALPCNDFGAQEPWDEARIQSYYKEEFGVTFSVTGKVGILSSRHALYEYIADAYGPDALPTWNFHKLLVGRDGDLRSMFPPSMSPTDPQVVSAIQRELEADLPRLHFS